MLAVQVKLTETHGQPDGKEWVSWSPTVEQLWDSCPSWNPVLIGSGKVTPPNLPHIFLQDEHKLDILDLLI